MTRFLFPLAKDLGRVIPAAPMSRRREAASPYRGV
jgi:hypothetical protein